MSLRRKQNETERLPTWPAPDINYEETSYYESTLLSSVQLITRVISDLIGIISGNIDKTNTALPYPGLESYGCQRMYDFTTNKPSLIGENLVVLLVKLFVKIKFTKLLRAFSFQ